MKSRTAATISCVISGLTNQVNVDWLHPTSGTSLKNVGGYIIEQGTLETTTQTSTLEILGTMVTEDKTFTCKVRSSAYPNSPSLEIGVSLSVYGELNNYSKFEGQIIKLEELI